MGFSRGGEGWPLTAKGTGDLPRGCRLGEKGSAMASSNSSIR